MYFAVSHMCISSQILFLTLHRKKKKKHFHSLLVEFKFMCFKCVRKIFLLFFKTNRKKIVWKSFLSVTRNLFSFSFSLENFLFHSYSKVVIFYRSISNDKTSHKTARGVKNEFPSNESMTPFSSRYKSSKKHVIYGLFADKEEKNENKNCC